MKKHIRILLVDDDNANLLMLQQILNSLYDVSVAFNAHDAIKSSMSTQYDLIIADVDLQDMEIFEFYHELERSLGRKNIPIIFMSSIDEPSIEEKCFKVGATDFINKNSKFATIEHRVLRVLELYQYRSDMDHVVYEKNRKIEKIRQDIVEAFASIIEGRDQLTGMHIQRTASYVSMVVKGLKEKNFYQEELEVDGICDAIVQSAPLHDIGKIAVSDSILLKPGRLTPDEFEKMKKHAEIGGRMIDETLRSIESPLVVQTAIDMATHHHEKWNGMGYPAHLKGVEIPLCARIMAIADVFDALVSKRCYKEAFTYDQSFDIIKQESGTHFDPKIAEVFLDMKDEIIKTSESWSLGSHSEDDIVQLD